MQLKNKKILYFITTKSGFCRNNYIAAAQEAMRQGAKISVLCRGGFEDNEYKKSGFRVFVYTDYSMMDIRKIYKTVNPDIVHHIGLGAIFRGCIAAMFVKPQYIFNTFLGRFGIPKSKFQRLLTKFLFRKDNTFLITENNEDKEDAINKKLISEDRVFVIPGLGIDAKEIKVPTDPKPPITFALADIIRWDRGVGEYIKAIQILKDKYEIDAKFILCGFADTANATNIPNKKILGWGIDTIDWWGYARDNLKVWSNAHIAVFPAYRNGMSPNISQAAACGKPIIISDTRGNNMFFENDKNCIMVEKKNPKALAEAMYTLYQDEKLRKKLGKEARTLAEKEFKSEKFLQMQIQLYKEGKLS